MALRLQLSTCGLYILAQLIRFSFLVHPRIQIAKPSSLNSSVEEQLQTGIYSKLVLHLIIYTVSHTTTPETMIHLFWECTFVQAFWNGIKQWMSKRPCFPNDVFSFQSCLGFVDNTSKILSHHFLLIHRYHIHWSKLMRLFQSPALCIQNFLTYLEVERRHALQNGNLEKFMQNGEPLYVKTISDFVLFLFKVWREKLQQI